MEKIKPCLQCGKTIKKPQNESLKNWLNRHKYCSRSCLAKYTYNLKLEKHKFSIERHYIPPTAIKKGQHLSSKTEFKKGIVPWSKGLKYSIEFRKKLSDTSYWRGKTGKLSPNWKGGISKTKERQKFYRSQPKTKLMKRLHQNKRKALKISSGDNSITRRTIESMIATQRGKCNLCKKILINFHIDHIFPLAKGGKHIIGNIQILCPTCNMKKGAKI